MARKARNRVLWAFDRPLHRDWAWWVAIGLTAAIGISTIYDPTMRQGEPVPLPVDMLGNIAITFFLIGWPIAALRRLVRTVLHQMKRRVRPAEPAKVHSATQLPFESEPTHILPETPRATATPPVPLGDYSGQSARESAALSRARETYPYPV